MYWQLVKESVATGKAEPLANYKTRGAGVREAPAVIQTALKGLHPYKDEIEEKVEDFKDSDGRLAVTACGFQFYLTRKMFDRHGNRTGDPCGCIRIGGRVVWTDPDGFGQVEANVVEIVSSELVRLQTDGGSVVEALACEIEAV